VQRPRLRGAPAVAVRLLTLVTFVTLASAGCRTPTASDPSSGHGSVGALVYFLLGALLIGGISALSWLAWRWLSRLRAEIQGGLHRLDQRVSELGRDLHTELERLKPVQPTAALKPDPPQAKKSRPEGPPSWWPSERNALLRAFQSAKPSLMEATPSPSGGAEAELSVEVCPATIETSARPDMGEVPLNVPPHLDEDTEGLATAWNESRGQAFTATLERRGFTYRSSAGLVAVHMGGGATDVLIFPAARSDVRGVTFGKYFEVTGRGKILWVVRPARVDASQFGGEATLESVPAYEVTKGEVRLE
jgi:hypothetical protein